MNLTQTFKSNRLMRFLTYSMIGLTAVLFSCSKKNDPGQTMPDVVAFSAINAAPDAGDLDFFIDNQKVNNIKFSYLTKLGYFGSFAGTKSLVVKIPGVGQQLLAKTVPMEANKTYSIFIAGTRDALEYVVTEDDLARPSSGKAKIRFVNLSPDANALNLGVAENQAVFSGLAYKASSNFQEVDAATVNLTIRDSSTGALRTTVAGVKLESAKVYTIYAKGLASESTGDKMFGLEVLKNL